MLEIRVSGLCDAPVPFERSQFDGHDLKMRRTMAHRRSNIR